ncbi:MAG: hypothetical protein HZA50_04205 [Planctomycetes bacterium]|nr:hypothetical protein [Planctomycetota bacterium]
MADGGKIELSRYRGMLTLLWIGLAIVAINCCLLAATGPSPKWIVPDQLPIGWNYFDRVSRTVCTISGRQTNGQLPEDEFYGMVLGLSSAGAGIDGGILAQEGGRKGRFASLCISGLSMNNLLLANRSLLHSDLRPGLVILGVHPYMMVGDPSRPKIELDPLPYVFAGQWKKAEKVTRAWAWAAANRKHINNRIRLMLYDGRLAFYDLLGLDFQSFSAQPPMEDPWMPPAAVVNLENPATNLAGSSRPSDSVEYKPLYGRAHDDWMEKVFRDRGWFDPQAYQKQYASSADDLVELAAGCRKLGAQVVIVLMPEGSRLRNQCPPFAEECLRRALADAFGNSVPVFSYRDRIPDDRFSDFVHLGLKGKIELSRMIAADLREFWRALGKADGQEK